MGPSIKIHTHDMVKLYHAAPSEDPVGSDLIAASARLYSVEMFRWTEARTDQKAQGESMVVYSEA